MDRWAGKVAVITGASAGIGLKTAQAFVRKGLIVVGLARRKAKMEESMSELNGPGSFYAQECDITNEQEVENAFKWIEENLGTIHILINNAGVLRERSIEDSDIKELQSIINVNLMGPIYCTKQAIKLMKENDEEGHITNICSISGLKTVTIPGKYYNLYSPSKFGVRSLSETLTHELNGTKIRVCNINPGVVKTELFEVADCADFLEMVPSLEPEDVANTIMHVIGAPQRIQITELTIRPTGEAL